MLLFTKENDALTHLEKGKPWSCVSKKVCHGLYRCSAVPLVTVPSGKVKGALCDMGWRPHWFLKS